MKQLDRRRFLFGGSAALAAVLAPAVAPVSQPAQQQFGEGYWDFTEDVFVWNNIGGDPLRVPYRQALMQDRITAAVPVHVIEGLLAKLEIAKKGPPNFTIENDHRSNIMLSGKGWIAHGVLADVPKWRKHISRRAWAVYFRDTGQAPQPLGGRWYRSANHQYRLILAEGCNNILLDRFEAPIVCVCEPIFGDACGKKR